MKKLILFLTIMLLLTVGVTQAAASSSEIVPTGVELDRHNVTLGTGETVQLTATVSPAYATNGALAWTSSDTQVATVSGAGLVTAVAGGEATITVRTLSG
ncbi:MAG: Ig-like domain-containing protein, partial [Tannerella sp.]|nr:Ig-like domain-containing protein [Tannerella sp.]